MTSATPQRHPYRALAAAVVLIAVAAAALAAQEPQELRGRIAAVAGDRITIQLTQSEWLPRPGMSGDPIDVALGQEIAGVFVPLKGRFAIVQVNADSCVAQPVGTEDHGEPAAGMLAVISTAYPNRPQRVADYRTPPNPAILQGANAGMTDAQHSLAMSAAGKGDYDGALAWWERAQAEGDSRFIIASAARGRARILVARDRFAEALAVLQDAAARTAPSPEELTFAAYPSSDYDLVDRAVELHVEVLEEGGTINQVWLRDIDEANRWYSAAARIMEAVAIRGVPSPDDPAHTRYLDMLVDLGSLYLDGLQDEENAVKWLQAAADAGSERAIQMLRAMGR